jgi:hypothetical protein
MQLNLQSIGQRHQTFFQAGLKTLAKETKFVRRRSKLSGTHFVQALVFTCLEKSVLTLSSLSQSCLALGVSIRQQGLDERINPQSVAFLQAAFAQALKHFRGQAPITLHLLEQFSHLYLVDSSQRTLPAGLADQLPGAGGNASPASLKIQLVVDYRLGQLAQVAVGPGCEPDQGYRGHPALISQGARFRMDLGYFVLDTFKAIADGGAYCLARFQAQTAVLSLSGKRLDLTALLAEQVEPRHEVKVLIGSRTRHQLAVRLIMVRLPQEVADRQRPCTTA